VVDLTCPTTGTGTSIRVRAVAQPAGSITRLTAAGHATGFSGGGLTVPWGIATDGDGNVWVALRWSAGVALLWLDPPPGVPLEWASASDLPAPYPFHGLQRNTGINIDASGNVWLANNWKETPPPANPGGDGLVALVGAASPVRMPLIGPPQRP
jgi:sugar lactone lactonase YvrE